MTIFTSGLNLIRDLHAADIVYGKLGTSGSAITVAQTDLVAGVAATLKTATYEQASQSNQFNYRIDSVTATANTFREFSLKNASQVSYDRSVFPGFSHTGDSELVVVKTIFYDQK